MSTEEAIKIIEELKQHLAKTTVTQNYERYKEALEILCHTNVRKD